MPHVKFAPTGHRVIKKRKAVLPNHYDNAPKPRPAFVPEENRTTSVTNQRSEKKNRRKENARIDFIASIALEFDAAQKLGDKARMLAAAKRAEDNGMPELARYYRVECNR